MWCLIRMTSVSITRHWHDRVTLCRKGAMDEWAGTNLEKKWLIIKRI